MSLDSVIETDVLVIGGGIAGCFAAIEAKERGLDVTIVDKSYAGKSGASLGACGGGIGVWLLFNTELGYDFDAAMNTANAKSEYINNREWSEVILEEAWDRYQDLVKWEVLAPIEMNKNKDSGKMTVANFPVYPGNAPMSIIPLVKKRIVPRKQAEKMGVRIIDRIMITDLLKQDGKVVGAAGFSIDSSDYYVFKAKAIVLSGGNNNFRSYGYFVNNITGDADGMAYRAGAEITGKEFPDQHYNYARYPAAPFNLLEYGAFVHFTDAEGKYIEHMPLDLTFASVIHAGRGPMLWDLDAAPPEVMQVIQETVREHAKDIARQDFKQRGKYPVRGGVAAGNSDPQTSGVWVYNTKCATSLPGLYAAGDCCGTRACGAKHIMGGWGLSGAAVTGKRAGAGAAEYALQVKKTPIDNGELKRLKSIAFAPKERKGGFSPRWVTQLIQNTMIPYFILQIKHEERLRAALTTIEFLRDHLVPKLVAKDAHELRLAHETKNLVLNAEMILRASLFRNESRGQHYREDYPRRDDPDWLAWVKIGEHQGIMKLFKEPVPKKWWPDLSRPYEERYPMKYSI